MNDIEQLQKDIQEIKDRNTRVEIDKAWEISLTRKVIVGLLTYSVVILFFVFANSPDPFVNAIVPTMGFVLSTLSIPLFKKWWIRRNK